MGDQARHVFEEALRLPLEQRADLAAELLRSLDENDADTQTPLMQEIERQWAEEITRRAERARRSESVGRDADAVLGAIESKLRRR